MPKGAALMRRDTDDAFQTIEACGVSLRVYTRDLPKGGVPLLICYGLGQAVEMLFPLMEQMRGRPFGWVGRLPQPALVISGLLDALIPAFNQMALASVIPDSKLVVYPAGHLLMYSEREDVATKVTEYLGKR